MITSYEVGAVLKIVDEVSPALVKMAAAAREFDAIIIRAKESLSSFSSTRLAGLIGRIGEVDKQLKGVADTSGVASKALTESFAAVDVSAKTSIDAIRAMKAEMTSLGATSRGMGRLAIASSSSSGSGGGAGGGGRAGFASRLGDGGHFGRVGIGSHGVTSPHYSMPSNPVMAVGAGLGYGAWLDAEMEDAIFQIEYHTGQKDSPETNAKYRKIIQDAMSKTGSSLSSVVEATKQEVRMFKGTPGGGVDVLPEMLSAAATEAKLKGTSLEESMTALIGLAHMTKEYSPEQIRKLAPAFAFLSASNPSSLGGIERAASYAVPILQSGMDVDPMQTLLLGTALTRAGATNTKSGTWLRNMALGAMPGTSLMSKMAFKKHEESLKALGLVDGDNKPTWFTDGKPDLIKMLGIAGDHAAAIPLEKRAGYEKQLFGSQGFGGFALLADPAVKQQIASLGSEMNSPEFKARYGNFMQDYSAASPMQQGRQLWADAQNALMDLGKTVLPSITQTIKDLDTGIKVSETQISAFTNAFAPAISALRGLGAALAGIHLPSWLGGGDGPPVVGGPGRSPSTPNFYNPHGDGPAPLGKQSSNDQPIHIKTAIYLDGRAIGENTSMHLARASTFPTQAAYGDSYLGWNAPDANFATG